MNKGLYFLVTLTVFESTYISSFFATVFPSFTRSGISNHLKKHYIMVRLMYRITKRNAYVHCPRESVCTCSYYTYIEVSLPPML